MVDEAQGSPPIELEEVPATTEPPPIAGTQEPAAPPPKAVMGRPTIYSEVLAEDICTRISNGDTLTGMCLEPGMPERNTVYGWLETKPDFSYAFNRARFRAAHAMGDELRHLAKVGGESAEREIAAIKWLLPRWLPHEYGEKVTLGIGLFQAGEAKRGVETEPAKAIEDQSAHSLGGQVISWKRSANGSGA